MQRIVLVLVLCALPTGPRAAPAGGVVTGTVLTVKHGKAVTNAENVYVYVRSLSPHRGPYGSGLQATIQQVAVRFEPHVVVVPTGASVSFPNIEHKKDLEHNVFSPGYTDGIGRFDLGRYKPGQGGANITRTFDVPGELDIYCDIHKEMTAKVKVIDSVTHGKVEGGKFTLGGVPAGRYRVVAWAPDSKEVVSDVIEVRDGETVTLSNALHLQLGDPKASHLNKDGKPYGPYPP